MVLISSECIIRQRPLRYRQQQAKWQEPTEDEKKLLLNLHCTIHIQIRYQKTKSNYTKSKSATHRWAHITSSLQVRGEESNWHKPHSPSVCVCVSRIRRWQWTNRIGRKLSNVCSETAYKSFCMCYYGWFTHSLSISLSQSQPFNILHLQ